MYFVSDEREKVEVIHGYMEVSIGLFTCSFCEGFPSIEYILLKHIPSLYPFDLVPIT